jgi:chaperonin GroEL (HSP60 family)
MINKLLTISIGANERYKESVDNNKKFNVSMDNKANVCFMIMTNDGYPERYSYQLLMDLENKSISTINKHYINKMTGDILALTEYFKTFAKDIQLYMVELERKYRNVVENDKILLIQNEIEDVKIDVKRNMNKMLTNIELVSNLEDKSNALKEMAHEFKRGGREVKNASWRRNKVAFVAGGLGLSAFIYFGARFFIK